MHKKTTNHIIFADGFSNSIKIFPLHSEKMTSPKKKTSNGCIPMLLFKHYQDISFTLKKKKDFSGKKRLQTPVYPCYF